MTTNDPRADARRPVLPYGKEIKLINKNALVKIIFFIIIDFNSLNVTHCLHLTIK